MNLLKYKWVFLLLGTVLFTACGNEYDVNEIFDLEELPGYVAFDAPGNAATLDTIFVGEDAGSLAINIECPTGTLSDVTINFEVSGSAEAGVDYNFQGSSSSIVLSPNVGDFQNRDAVDLMLDILADSIADGNKTLKITLTGASNAEGDLAVGRGGTDFLKSANVVITDID